MTAGAPWTEAEEPADAPVAVALAGWPAPLHAAAYHGVVGDVLAMIGPQTEAAPVAIVLQLLAALGNAIGRGPYVPVEADRHHANLFVVNAGRSSKARKGTSWGQVRRLMQHADPAWTGHCVGGGFTSGEGIIAAVRDPQFKQEKVKIGNEIAYETVQFDNGEPDKRLMWQEGEFASVLAIMARDGSAMSPRVREAWDHGDLKIKNKNSPMTATGAHVSLVGHITRDELRRMLTKTEFGNGFANRILWCVSERVRRLARGGYVSPEVLAKLGQDLRRALEGARRRECVSRTEAFWAGWEAVYPTLSDGHAGLLGAVLSRAEAQVLRLALIYALLDGVGAIDAPHLLAALAVWDYCEASARYLFADDVGDPTADTILRGLRQAGGAGLTRSDLHSLFFRNASAPEIDRGLGVLIEHRLVRQVGDEARKPGQRGRSPERWVAVISSSTSSLSYVETAQAVLQLDLTVAARRRDEAAGAA